MKEREDWSFSWAEIPLSLENDRGPNPYVGTIEGLTYCNYLFAQQSRKYRFIRETLFKLMEGKDYLDSDPICHSTRIHIRRALAIKITFAFHLKLTFLEILK